MSHRPAKSRTTIAPKREKHEDHGRLRGSAGVKQRKRRLAAEPLCRRCKERGIIRLAEVIDHEKPLALGGTDTDDNCRPLCNDCHDEVTREQFGHRKRVTIGEDGWPSRT